MSSRSEHSLATTFHVSTESCWFLVMFSMQFCSVTKCQQPNVFLNECILNFFSSSFSRAKNWNRFGTFRDIHECKKSSARKRFDDCSQFLEFLSPRENRGSHEKSWIFLAANREIIFLFFFSSLIIIISIFQSYIFAIVRLVRWSFSI